MPSLSLKPYSLFNVRTTAIETAISAGWAFSVMVRASLGPSHMIADSFCPSASSTSSKKAPVHHAKISPPSSKQTVSAAKKDSPPDMGNQRAALKYAPKQTETDKPSRQLPKIPVRKKIIKSGDLATSGQTRPLPRAAPSKSQMTRSQITDPKNTIEHQRRAPVTSPTKKANPMQKSPQNRVNILDNLISCSGSTFLFLIFL